MAISIGLDASSRSQLLGILDALLESGYSKSK